MTHDLLIRGARVLDGSGSAPFRADVAVRGERIVAVGELAGVSEGATTTLGAYERRWK